MTGVCHNRDFESRAIAEAFSSARMRLAERVLQQSGLVMMGEYSDATDAMVSQVAAACGISVGRTGGCAPSLAIAAVGGYGRREMSPYSDVDIAFVVPEANSAGSDALIKRAFRMLTDICDAAGVKFGYSYRIAAALDDLDLESRTALLDARLIAGSSQVFSEFETAVMCSTMQAEFVIGHLRLRERGVAACPTPYATQPDIKEGTGGLRDLQTARWIARVAFRAPANEVWNTLRAHRVLSGDEIRGVEDALEFLSRLRGALHLAAGRALETLGFDRQEAVAPAMGFDSPDRLMACYYFHSARIARVYRNVADACLEENLTIEPGIAARGGQLFISDRGLLDRDSAAWVRMLEHCHSYGLRLSRQAERAVGKSRRPLRLTRDAAAAFLAATSRKGASAVLRQMAEMGLLQAAISRFDELMSLVPADSAHLYTVGEHSLRTVEQLEALDQESAEQFADAFARVPDYAALVLAALMHDIGKLERSDNHSTAGAKMAAETAVSLGMPAESVATMEFLVGNHLQMSETARLRDLHKKRTIVDFAKLVGNRANLAMLFLLTVADSRAVGTRNWSAVHNRFLLELYERACVELNLPGAQLADLDRHKKRVRRELSIARLPEREVDEHCESMPASYLLNTSPDELAAHIGFVRTVRSVGPVVDVSDDRLGRFSRVTVAARDRPGLLGDITGVLYSLGVDIHAAQIYTRRSKDRIALDLLYVDFERAALSETMKRQVEADLTDVLSGKLTALHVLACRGRESCGKISGASVTVADSPADQETVLEVRAPDSPGFLHNVTRLISGLGFDIHSARVSTWGGEARDVFYITNAEGCPLSVSEIESLQLSFAGSSGPGEQAGPISPR